MHAGLYYHLVHMCKAILSAFHLARHVRESPHLGTEAAARLWPLKPWTHSRASTTQHRPVRTQQNKRAATLTGVTASDQMVVWVCVCVWLFSDNKASQGRLSVSCRFDGSWVEGWRDGGSKDGDEGITKSWQLVSFFPDRAYTRDSLGRCLLLVVTDLLFLLYF